MEQYGIRGRVSSVAFPHSNCRAEIGVKTMKRLITDNTGPSGSLNTDAVLRALLQYRNTPDPVTGMSPAEIVFGRQIRDFTPVLPGKYKPRDEWRRTLEKREEALSKRHFRHHEKWSEHTKNLPPLRVGDCVYIQNQVGNHPRRWDKSGVVVEVKQNHQYQVKKDGSGIITLRNRKFLRKFTPFNATKLPVQPTLPPTFGPVSNDPGVTKSKHQTTVNENITTTKTGMTPTSLYRGNVQPPALTPNKKCMSSPVPRNPTVPKPPTPAESSDIHDKEPGITVYQTNESPVSHKVRPVSRTKLVLERPDTVLTRSGRESKPVIPYDSYEQTTGNV